MKNKIFLFLILSVVAVFLNDSATAESGSKKIEAGEWNEDYEGTLKEAEKSGKPIMLDFTGSDWCGWCVKLKKEVFDQQEFKKFSKENLFLVELDFPRGKTQSSKIKEQNQKLAQKYEIQGYPALIILNAKGEKIGEMGYVEGGPEPFIAQLKTILSSGK